METLQSVLLLVRRGDSKLSIDLKDAYLHASGQPQVPQIRNVWGGVSVQSPLLCTLHGFTVLTRVVAPVLAFLHRSGICLRRDLNDWLLQASSREQVLLALDTVPHLCRSLGIVVNWEKSQLVPTQCMVYRGVLLDSVSFRASARTG